MQKESKSTVRSRLFILDLDRCLLNNHIYVLFDEVVANLAFVDAHLLRQARYEREVSGGSFDSIRWLQEQDGFGEQEHSQLVHEFIKKAHSMDADSFLSPGARSLLDVCESLEIPHVIMTYGGRENQIAKIRAARLDTTPYIIVDRKQKAEYITEWWNEAQGQFEVTIEGKTYQGETAILVDDKATAFDNLPVTPRARGYWLQAAHLLPSQQGIVPSNVSIVHGFDEIMTAEKLLTP